MTSDVLRSLLPTFYFHRPLMKKVSRAELPFYPTGFILLFPYLLFFYWGGEVNIKVDEKIRLD